jgi:GNAT superfamily N-acetyltransferase
MLREATVADVPQLFDVRCSVRENHMSIAQLAKAGITPESIGAMIEGGDYTTPVVEERGAIVAFAMAQLSTGYVFALFVRPECENRGLGTALLDHVELALRRRGIKLAWLATGAERAARAHGFYRARRWTATGTMPDGQIRFEKQLIAPAGPVPADG